MLHSPHRHFAASPEERELARSSRRSLARLVHADQTLSLLPADHEDDRPIEIPAGAVALLMDILDAMAAGRGVTLVQEAAEMTTVQAAELLRVSRPYLIGLLESGAIPFRRVGKHRRIRGEDIIAYKERTDRAREAVLDELAALAQKHDFGYGPS